MQTCSRVEDGVATLGLDATVGNIDAGQSVPKNEEKPERSTRQKRLVSNEKCTKLNKNNRIVCITRKYGESPIWTTSKRGFNWLYRLG